MRAPEKSRVNRLKHTMGEPQNNPNNNLDFVDIQIKDYNLDLMLPVLDQPIAKVKGTSAPEEKGLNDIVY